VNFETQVFLSEKLVGLQVAAAPAGESPIAESQDARIREEDMRVRQKEKEEIERVLSGLGQVAGSPRAGQQDYLEQMRRLAVELGVAIASHLVHDQIQAGDYPLETIVRHIVARLETPQPVSVFLHPDDLVLLQRRLGESAVFPKETAVHLVADSSMSRGSVRAQAGDLSVLGDLEEQLTDIRRSLIETLPAAVKQQCQEMVRELRSYPESA
jgi:flagellar biosynthesis/type III secretory pathway protein FliH